MTHLIAFDLDGTLVDTPTAIVETFTASFAALGHTPREAAAIRATIGLPLERAFSDLLGIPIADTGVSDGVLKYQTLFRELIVPKAKELIFPGVVDGLKSLREAGFLLAVATSKFYASADILLRAAGLRDCFDMVVGADQVDKPKPHPEMGEMIMRELGVPAERSVMVGDTTHDLLMAKSAGMRSIAVTYGVHGAAELRAVEPTWLVDSFPDVLACLHDEFRIADVTPSS